MTNVVACGGILGLFPSLVPVGGVQVSGRLVADRFFLKRADHEEASNGTANFLLTYGPEGPTADQLAFNNTVHAGTKIAAVRIAVSKTWGHSTILVWHLHLIRLLPFLR